MWQVVDELAADNEYWAENFMQGWQDMVTNRNGSNIVIFEIISNTKICRLTRLT